MLEGLDAINWAELTHAYGPANDVPGLIRKLASRSARVREGAYRALRGNLWHQHTVYEATAFAVPFLVQLLQSPDVKDKDKLLIYLYDLANGQSFLDVHQHLFADTATVESVFADQPNWPGSGEQLRRELGWVKAARDAVRAGRDAYHQLLDNGDVGVRLSAAYLLANLKEDAKGVAPQLLAFCKRQTNPRTRAGAVFTLREMAPSRPELIAYLKEVLRADEDVSVRTASAVALAPALRSKLPAAAVQLLTDAVLDPGPLEVVFDQFPEGVVADARVEATTALALAGRAAKRAIPSILAALKAGQSFVVVREARTLHDPHTDEEMAIPEMRVLNAAGHDVVFALLHLAFDGKPLPKTATAKTLTPEQKEALQGLTQAQLVWPRGKATVDFRLENILRGFGLPGRCNQLRAFLAGKFKLGGEKGDKMGPKSN
jgi:hypothetical protein